MSEGTHKGRPYINYLCFPNIWLRQELIWIVRRRRYGRVKKLGLEVNVMANYASAEFQKRLMQAKMGTFDQVVSIANLDIDS
jgi:hypothetical protein